MSNQLDAYGNPASVGDPGRGDEVYDPVGIGPTVTDVRTLALYDLLKLRLVRTVSVASPAVGADWTASPPAGTVWEVLAVQALLTTSAVVANRQPVIQWTVDGNVIPRVGPVTVDTASATWRHTWAVGYGSDRAGSSNNGIMVSLPPVPLRGGDTIGTVTGAIDTGDQWSGIFCTVREWSVGQVYWTADLLGRELGFEALTDLPSITPTPEGTGQPIPVSPIAR